jgi:hypothetical protein
MTEIERLKKNGKLLTWLVLLSLIGIGILFTAWILIPPVSADATVLRNGTFYWRNITPQNNIYEKVVMPGDTILLGHFYDLTKVYGYSGDFAHWNDQSLEGMNCHPDIVNTVNYIKTNGKIKKDNVYLDPKNWTTGDWLQWEGCYQKPYDRSLGYGEFVPYIADDNLMFTIISDPYPTPAITRVPLPTITTIPTPMPTTLKPVTLAPEPKKTDPFPMWIVYIGGFLIVIFIVVVFWEDQD